MEMIRKSAVLLALILIAISGCEIQPPVGAKYGTGGGLTSTDYVAGGESELYVLGWAYSVEGYTYCVIAVSRDEKPEACIVSVNNIPMRQEPPGTHTDTRFAYYTQRSWWNCDYCDLVINTERDEHIYGDAFCPEHTIIKTPSAHQGHPIKTDLGVEWEQTSDIECSEIMVYDSRSVFTYSSGELDGDVTRYSVPGHVFDTTGTYYVEARAFTGPYLDLTHKKLPNRGVRNNLEGARGCFTGFSCTRTNIRVENKQ
jgi:hypothetical protein